MRDIKFRAWDNHYKYMNYKVLVGIYGEWEEVKDDENYTSCAMWIEPKNVDYKCEPHWTHFEPYHKDINLMQYTGLKDKNGKEIYEGDIVEYANQYKYIVCLGEYNINPSHCAEAIIVGYYLKSIKSKLMPEEQLEHLYSIDGTGARFPKHCAIVDEEKAIETFKLEVIGNIYENKDLLEKEGK